jgi:hypothetical protein
LAGVGRQADLPHVVQVLDDHDDSRDQQEERHGRQDLRCDSPERHASDRDRDEESDHSMSSPARGGTVIEALRGVLSSPRSGYDIWQPLDLIWIPSFGA